MTKEEYLNQTGEFLIDNRRIYDVESTWYYEKPIEGLESYLGEKEKCIDWESIECEYRCEVCLEDQCLCEDGYKRKIASIDKLLTDSSWCGDY